MARLAGSQVATTAAPTSASAAAPRLTGSSGSVSNSSPRSTRVDGERQHQTGDGASHGQPQALAEHQPAHVACSRAEREADTDLALALAHGRRHHAIKADAREQQRRHGEDAQEQRVEARPSQRPAQVLGVRCDAGYPHSRVGRPDGVANNAGHERRRGSGTDRQPAPPKS